MPNESKAQAMRERIVTAAVRIRGERGVTNTTTKEIAREAGVSEGSLYNHFDSKIALFGAAFGLVASGIRSAMQDLFAAVGEATLENNLAQFAASAIRFYGDLLPMTGSVLADRDVLAWLQRTGRAGGLSQGHAALVRTCRRSRRSGALDRRLSPRSSPPRSSGPASTAPSPPCSRVPRHRRRRRASIPMSTSMRGRSCGRC